MLSGSSRGRTAEGQFSKLISPSPIQHVVAEIGGCDRDIIFLDSQLPELSLGNRKAPRSAPNRTHPGLNALAKQISRRTSNSADNRTTFRSLQRIALCGSGCLRAAHHRITNSGTAKISDSADRPAPLCDRDDGAQCAFSYSICRDRPDDLAGRVQYWMFRLELLLLRLAFCLEFGETAVRKQIRRELIQRIIKAEAQPVSDRAYRPCSGLHRPQRGLA